MSDQAITEEVQQRDQNHFFDRFGRRRTVNDIDRRALSDKLDQLVAAAPQAAEIAQRLEERQSELDVNDYITLDFYAEGVHEFDGEQYQSDVWSVVDDCELDGGVGNEWGLSDGGSIELRWSVWDDEGFAPDIVNRTADELELVEERLGWFADNQVAPCDINSWATFIWHCDAARREFGYPPAEAQPVDLTFSAPKSVSTLHALADPATAATIEAAHDRAVEAAMRFEENHRQQVADDGISH